MTLVPTQRRNVVDFTVGEVSELLQKEIRGAEITGTLRNNRVARTCNIIDSSILPTVILKITQFGLVNFEIPLLVQAVGRITQLLARPLRAVFFLIPMSRIVRLKDHYSCVAISAIFSSRDALLIVAPFKIA